MKAQEVADYRDLLGDIKTRVRQAQHRAALSANAEMIRLYWDIGCLIAARQEREGWGAGVIPRLALDLRNELPEQKGFSERNLKYMIRFAREYGVAALEPQPGAPVVQPPAALSRSVEKPTLTIVQRAAAQSPFPPDIILSLPWFHHVVLFEKIKDLPTRLWYTRQTLDVKTREIVYLLFKQLWAPLLPILQGLNGREMP